MFHRTAIAISAFALSLATAAPLLAGEGQPVATKAAATVAQAPTYSVIKHEQVRSLLENMGFEVSVVEGDQWFRFGVERSGWTIQLQVAVSEQTVYVMSLLNSKERMKEMPIEYYQRLLGRNSIVFPYSFLLTNGDLYLAHSLPNQNVTPAALRKLIDNVAIKCIESGDYWVTSRALKQIEEARAGAAPTVPVNADAAGKAQAKK